MPTTIDPLLSIDPSGYTTGIAYIRALVHEDPSICMERWLRIIKYHDLDKLRGYSKARYYDAVREWRRSHGLPPMKHTDRKAARTRPANAEVGESATDTTHQHDGAVEQSEVHPVDAAVADHVWEWMDENGYDTVTFFDDGEVNVSRRQTSRTREFSLVVEDSGQEKGGEG
jgi:hypothetical protein